MRWINWFFSRGEAYADQWIELGLLTDRPADLALLAARIGVEVTKLIQADVARGGSSVTVKFVVLTREELEASRRPGGG